MCFGDRGADLIVASSSASSPVKSITSRTVCAGFSDVDLERIVKADGCWLGGLFGIPAFSVSQASGMLEAMASGSGDSFRSRLLRRSLCWRPVGRCRLRPHAPLVAVFDLVIFQARWWVAGRLIGWIRVSCPAESPCVIRTLRRAWLAE